MAEEWKTKEEENWGENAQPTLNDAKFKCYPTLSSRAQIHKTNLCIIFPRQMSFHLLQFMTLRRYNFIIYRSGRKEEFKKPNETCYLSSKHFHNNFLLFLWNYFPSFNSLRFCVYSSPHPEEICKALRNTSTVIPSLSLENFPPRNFHLPFNEGMKTHKYSPIVKMFAFACWNV